MSDLRTISDAVAFNACVDIMSVDFDDLAPWLVDGVCKGTGSMWKNEFFRRWIVAQAEGITEAASQRACGRDLPPSSFAVSLAIRLAAQKYVWDCESRAEKATAAIRAFFEVIELPLPDDVLTRFENRAKTLYWYGEFEDWMKFHLCSAFALATGQDLPKQPTTAFLGLYSKPGVFLPGVGYRLLRRLRRKGLCWENASLLLAKKGFPAFSEWKVERSLAKHRAALSTPPPTAPIRDLEQEVERTVDEIASRIGTGSSETSAFRLPSGSGHLESTRTDLGALGVLSHLARQVEMEQGHFDAFGLATLFGERVCSGRSDEQVEIDSSLAELPGGEDWVSFADEMSKDLDSRQPVDLEALRRVAQAFCDKVVAGANPWGPHGARAVPITEPFKVRTVTGGPELEYYWASYIQKRVHSWLRRHRCFQLIGKPLEQADIDWVLEKLEPGMLLNSADYQAATDNLHPRLSRVAALRIAQRLKFGHWTTQLFLSTLTDHELTYDNVATVRDGSASFVRQRNGQLMGSPTSFPILCVINAALTRYAMERSSGRRMSLEECRILVNGDDLLHPLRPEQLDEWVRQTARGGLERSVGKSYVSNAFCTLNSECYEVSWHCSWFGDVRPVATRVPAVNLGLLLASNVKKGKGLSCLAPSETFRFQDIAQMAEELIEGFPTSKADQLLTMFIRSWDSSLKAVPGGMSWFTPKSLGGLGLPWLRESAPELSVQQRKFTTWMASGCDAKEYMRRRACLQEKTGEIGLWVVAGRELLSVCRNLHLGGVFMDEAEARIYGDRLMEWLSPLVAAQFLNGQLPETTELDRFKMLNGNFARLWRRGQAHSLTPLDWGTVRSYRRKRVELALPSPPSDWRINVAILSH